MKFACQKKDGGADKSTAAAAGGGACERREKVEGRAAAGDVVDGHRSGREPGLSEPDKECEGSWCFQCELVRSRDNR